MAEKVNTCPVQSHLKTNLSIYLLYLQRMMKDMFSYMMVCQFVCLSICNTMGKRINFSFKATCYWTDFKKHHMFVTSSLYLSIPYYNGGCSSWNFHHPLIDKLRNCSQHGTFLQYSAWISDSIKQCNSFFLCWYTVRRYWQKSIQSESELL